MALKDILVVVNNARSTGARIDVAARLAVRHGAHLTGLFVRTPAVLPQAVRGLHGDELAKIHDRHVDEAAEDGRRLFAEKTSGLGLGTRWLEPHGPLLEEAARQAKCADLAVIGQYDRASDTAEGEARLIEHLVLDAGRAVLAVPYGGLPSADIGRRVMVAWNGSREAARAVSDALPLLTRADEVWVVAVSPASEADAPGVPVEEIVLHLQRHGVPVRAEHVRPRGVGVGAVLTAQAADLGADLMVMGTYGHSRLREVVLGGATNHVLHHMKVPVLLSH